MALPTCAHTDSESALAPSSYSTLLTVGLNGHASQRDLAKVVRIYLEGHHGRQQLRQRPHDDSRCAPSLFV
jgi:hypothetical protein